MIFYQKLGFPVQTSPFLWEMTSFLPKSHQIFSKNALDAFCKFHFSHLSNIWHVFPSKTFSKHIPLNHIHTICGKKLPEHTTKTTCNELQFSFNAAKHFQTQNLIMFLHFPIKYCSGPQKKKNVSTSITYNEYKTHTDDVLHHKHSLNCIRMNSQ